MDQELLQAIGEIMDQKLAAQKVEIAHDMDEKLAAQKAEIAHDIDEKLAAQKAEIAHDMDEKLAAQKAEITHETRLLMENIFMPRFNLLAENQQIIMEKLKGLDDLEIMDTRISALEAMVKKINRELKELKKAQ